MITTFNISHLSQNPIYVIFCFSEFFCLRKMGCTLSDPLPDLGDVGYVCVLMEEANKCRFIHAPKNVTDAVAKLVR